MQLRSAAFFGVAPGCFGREVPAKGAARDLGARPDYLGPMLLGRPDYKSADCGSAGVLGSPPGFRDSATIFRGVLSPRVAALVDVAAERFGGLSGRNWGPKFGGPGGRTWATLSQIARFRVGRRSAKFAGAPGDFGS